MYERMTKEHQPAATLEASRRLDEKQFTLAPGPPRPGDVFVSRRTAELPVEWLVVETEDGRARVVPVDEFPLVGSRDLELDGDVLAGAAVSRCDLDLWVASGELDGELRTGAVTGPDLEGVHGKRRALAGGRLEPTLAEEEVDTDPEYLRWRQGTLGRARALLEGASDEVPRTLMRPVKPHVPGWARLALAASVIVALLLGAQLVRIHQRLGHQEGRVAELDRARQELTERLSRSEAGHRSTAEEKSLLETALEALEGEKQELQQRLLDAFDDTAVVNVPWFLLGSDARRQARLGEAEVLSIGNAPRMNLSVAVDDAELYGAYRIEFIDRATGVEAWEIDGLRKMNGKWLRLDVPTSLFEETEYELKLYGLGRGEAELLEERYVVKIEG